MKTATATVAAVAAVAAVIACAAPASATPADRIATTICTTLSDAPLPATIDGIGLWLLANGATPEQTADLIVTAIYEYCPEHTLVLERYVTLEKRAGRKAQ